MANNSLNKEKDNIDKLRELEAKEKLANKKRVITLAIIAAVILVVAAYVVSLILFEAARPWMISITIGVLYIALWSLIRFKTDFNYVSLYIVTNVCLSIACIPLYCISGTPRILSFGFALAIFVSAVVLLVKCLMDMERTRKGMEYKYDEIEYATTFIFTLIGGVMFSIALGLIFTGLTRALFIGGGIFIMFCIMSILPNMVDCFDGLEFWMVVFYIILGLTGIAFLIVSYNFTVMAIALFAAIVFSGTILALGDEDFFAATGVGALLAGVAVLVLLFGHVYTNGDFYIKDGVLISYSGTEEVVVIPEEVTSINKKAFKNAGPKKNMKEVVLHDGITDIGKKAFKNCDALETVVIPDGVKTLSEGAFYNCSSLKSITVAGSVSEISLNVFWGCIELEEVILEEGIKKIGSNAFYNCGMLESVVLPESLEYLGSFSLSGCDKLSEVYIHSGIDSIGGRIFEYNDSKITVYFYGTEEEWNDIEKSKSPKWNGGAKVDVVYNHE